MKILLVNVDCKWNLALRRLYAFHENIGNDVNMIELEYGFYPHKKRANISAFGYDKVYVSNIFETNRDRINIIGCDDVVWGGVGSKTPFARLEPEVEATHPKYFEDEDTAHGFITRGCIRKCYFCKVPKHEGYLRPYRSVQEVVGRFKKAIFMDNNILAWEGACDAMDWLAKNNIKCEFNQGLDIRLANDENLNRLAQLNYMGEYVFAFDDVHMMEFMDERIQLVKKYIPKPWKLKMFIYSNADTMEPIDTVRRVEWCKRNEILPYVMRDKNCYDSVFNKFYIDLASWTNQPAIFKKMGFNEFLKRRHPNNPQRQDESFKVYNGDTPFICESCWNPSLNMFKDETGNAVCEKCLLG